MTLFSTHVPGDVEQVVEQVVVLATGRVRYADSLEALRGQARGQVWEVRAPSAAAVAAGSGRVSRVTEREGECILRVVGEPLPGYTHREVEPTLEDAYLYLLRKPI